MNDESQPNEGLIGSPIPNVFPPDRLDARFVVSMSMARNDIDRAYRGLLRSEDEDRQDFTYRVRLATAHIVEAIDALGFYRQTFNEVRKLLGRVSKEGKKDLKIVRGTLQKAGKGALEDVRNHTFHYPSPDPHYHPATSDEKLGKVLAAMTDVGASFHFDGDTRTTTMSFADEASLQLAMGRPTVDAEEAVRPLGDSPQRGARVPPLGRRADRRLHQGERTDGRRGDRDREEEAPGRDTARRFARARNAS